MVSGEINERAPAVQAPDQSGRVTFTGNLSDDLAPGTWNRILKQAGLKE